MPEPSWEDLEKQLSASMLPNKDDDPLRVEREAEEAAETHEDILSTLPPLEGAAKHDPEMSPVLQETLQMPGGLPEDHIWGTPASQLTQGQEDLPEKIEELREAIANPLAELVRLGQQAIEKLDELMKME